MLDALNIGHSHKIFAATPLEAVMLLFTVTFLVSKEVFMT